MPGSTDRVGNYTPHQFNNIPAIDLRLKFMQRENSCSSSSLKSINIGAVNDDSR